jgi:hypothetical protein
MREIDSGKGMAEVARMYQPSPKRLETWRSEWRAKGELAFPGKGAQPQTKLDADRMSELDRKIGQQTMKIDFSTKSVAAFQGTSSASRRQWRYRLHEQIQEAGEAGTIVNRLSRAAGISRAGHYRFRQRGKGKRTDMDLGSQMQRIALRWPAYGYRWCMPNSCARVGPSITSMSCDCYDWTIYCACGGESSCSEPPGLPTRIADLSQPGRRDGVD